MTWLHRAYIVTCVLVMAACALWMILLAKDCYDRKVHREHHRIVEP